MLKEVAQNSSTLDEWFARRDTPAAGSPVGVTMVRILKKNRGMGFEAARVEAKKLLDRSARAKVYRLPRPLSPEEQEIRKARLVAAFGRTTQDAVWRDL